MATIVRDSESECRTISCDNGNDYESYLLQDLPAGFVPTFPPGQECRTIVCDNGNDYDTYLLEDLPLPIIETFFNDTVYFGTCPDGTTMTFSGTLPAWITIDTVNNRLVGAAGTFQASSKAIANAHAQEALNAFGNAAQDDDTLTCEPDSNICTDGPGDLLDNIYQIQGYVDGLFANASGGFPGIKPVWDGTFPQSSPDIDAGIPAWVAGANGTLQMSSKALCNSHIEFDGCIANIPQWKMVIENNSELLWVGLKAGGATPEGTYEYLSGPDVAPLSVIVEIGAGATTPFVGSVGCGS